MQIQILFTLTCLNFVRATSVLSWMFGSDGSYLATQWTASIREPRALSFLLSHWQKIIQFKYIRNRTLTLSCLNICIKTPWECICFLPSAIFYDLVDRTLEIMHNNKETDPVHSQVFWNLDRYFSKWCKNVTVAI